MTKTVDFLIIGQGLAGSLLGWELLQRGCSILIVDNGFENASQVAAGLINPITGMRFVKTHAIEELLPSAKEYYLQLGIFFKENFYIEKPLWRILKNPAEIQQLQKRLQDNSYTPYFKEIQQPTEINAPLGVIEQQQTAYLLTAQLLAKLQQFFIEQQSYTQEIFKYPDLVLSENICWKHITCKKIIFCEGHFARYNPWFKKLPFQCVKGEILTLTSSSSLPNKIINAGHWMIPLENFLLRTGATFDRDNLDTHITEAAKIELMHYLQTILPQATFNILKQQANIRPCTLDKLPFLGCHPHYPQLAIFNGFGAKGSLQIPYYSQQFVAHLLNQQPLAKPVDCLRYF